MSNKIITNVVSLLYQKFDKEFKDLKELLDKVDQDILDLEISLSEKNKQRYNIQKKLEEIERRIVESMFKGK